MGKTGYIAVGIGVAVAIIGVFSYAAYTENNTNESPDVDIIEEETPPVGKHFTVGLSDGVSSSEGP